MNWRWEGLEAQEIFNAKSEHFADMALSLYRWQVANNPVLREYLQLRQTNLSHIQSLHEIVPLPISFFKTHKVVSGSFQEEIVFSSSGTTGADRSLHYVRSRSFYHRVAIQSYLHAFGHHPAEMDFYFLLPGYMERGGSSLIDMAEAFRKVNEAQRGGFYLNATSELFNAMQASFQTGRRSMLFGVTFALLDLVRSNTIHALPPGSLVLETGGMKGRGTELTRTELHEKLCEGLGVKSVCSEYGMTELLSQAYAIKDGLFLPPPWMKVLIRSEDDPTLLSDEGTGLLVMIDLANQGSCAFIETQDIGRLFSKGSFEVLGRLDASDLRGCSLLTA